MLVYEMLTGLPPWYTKDRRELFRRIQHAPLTFPLHVSRRAQSLIKGLLTRNPNVRLGCSSSSSNQKKVVGSSTSSTSSTSSSSSSGSSGSLETVGVSDLKRHPFFKSVDWNLLQLRKLSPPFAPKNRQSSEKDTANFAKEFTRLPLYSTSQSQKVEQSDNGLSSSPTFQGFTYEGSPSKLRMTAERDDAT